MKEKSFGVICVITILLLIAAVIGLYRDYGTFNKVMAHQLRGIADASYTVKNLSEENVDKESYGDIMDTYVSSVSYQLDSINAIVDNAWFYKKYEVDSFINFVMEMGTEVPNSTEKRQKNLDLIINISNELESVSPMYPDYNYLTDPENIASKIQKIDKMCEEYILN